MSGQIHFFSSFDGSTLVKSMHSRFSGLLAIIEPVFFCGNCVGTVCNVELWTLTAVIDNVSIYKVF